MRYNRANLKTNRKRTLSDNNIVKTSCGQAFKYLYEADGKPLYDFDAVQDIITCEQVGSSNKYKYFVNTKEKATETPIQIKPNSGSGNKLDVRTCLGYELHDAIEKKSNCSASDMDMGNTLVDYLARLEMGTDVRTWTPPYIYRFFEILFSYFDISNEQLTEILNGANVVLKNDLGWVFREIGDERNAYVTATFGHGSSHESEGATRKDVAQPRVGNGSIPCLTPGRSAPNFELLLGTQRNKKGSNVSTWFQFEKDRGNRQTGNMVTWSHTKDAARYATLRMADKARETIGWKAKGSNIGPCGESTHHDGNKLEITLKRGTCVVQDHGKNRYKIIKCGNAQSPKSPKSPKSRSRPKKSRTSPKKSRTSPKKSRSSPKKSRSSAKKSRSSAKKSRSIPSS